MPYIGSLFLKVKLHGMGWDHDPEAKNAYGRLQQSIAKFVQSDEYLVDDGKEPKTVAVIICRELDAEGIHSIEDKGLSVHAKDVLPLQGRYTL